MAASNALGEKIPMFVIGKSAKPRFYKHVRNLSCPYWAQKKHEWMEGFLKSEYVNLIASLKDKDEKLAS